VRTLTAGEEEVLSQSGVRITMGSLDASNLSGDVMELARILRE
jgi:hypothetical protein